MQELIYPFVPKSTRPLIPGQFWAVPISKGRYACGRVISLRPKGNSFDLRGFLAGLLDWVGTQLPTGEAIAGKKILEQGHAHIKAITETGGVVLGHRSLDVDGIAPGLFLSESPGPDCLLQRGFEQLRPATRREQRELDVLGTWGYKVIQVLAEKHFSPARRLG